VRSWLDAGVDPADIGIGARSNMLVDSAVSTLTKADVSAYSLAAPRPA
jgi:hypothetical protein